VSSRSTVEVGHQAETLAAEWLEVAGFHVLARNWRTRWCELDIVCCRQSIIHIVEVKYRRSDAYGSGFEYITPLKAARLQRAALAWLRAHGLSDYPCQLDVIAVSGYPEPKSVAYLPNAIQSG
jgi:uncharacterized protein (TIGR00252 family)